MEKKNGPWVIKSTISKYKNPWIEVNEDQVIRPDGKPGIFGIVKMVPGISVLPVDESGFVYLTEEFRYAIEKDSIEAVSGGIDGCEKPLDAAKRELKEELGIHASEWIDLGIVNPFTSVVSSPAHIFLAKGLKFSKPNPEGTEIIKMKKMKIVDAINSVLDNKITHGPTSVLILKAKNYLNI
ncbi:MAG TPA: NUDIX hydrolase [Candidatus Nanoarchaeia archaeon]|nr:NUDIX hydrolase [Candidatus Nanoarchaeia archaeon]